MVLSTLRPACLKPQMFGATWEIDGSELTFKGEIGRGIRTHNADYDMSAWPG
jgi:hypothetical protein